MIRHALLFVFGFAIGICFDSLPSVVERTFGIYLCRESCPGWFRLSAILVYLTMPILWGLLSMFAFRKKTIKGGVPLFSFFFLASTLLMIVMTWASYRLHRH